MLTFNFRFFVFALLLFIVEVLIALFVHDGFIRPYFGDYLVVILIYCALRTIIKASPLKVAIAVLLFSYAIEVLQYFSIVDSLGLTNNKLARVVIGYGFEWLDLLAYTLGIVTVLFVEATVKKYSNALPSANKKASNFFKASGGD